MSTTSSDNHHPSHQQQQHSLDIKNDSKSKTLSETNNCSTTTKSDIMDNNNNKNNHNNTNIHNSSLPLKFASHLAVTIFITLIKIIVILYSIITLPIYYYVQKPWLKTDANKQKKALQRDPSNPYSPWIRVQKQPKTLIDGCENINQLFERVVADYGNERAFGFRPVLEEAQDLQANGRIFRKYVLGDYQWLTYNQANEKINRLANGFSKLGIKHGDIVMIISDTRLEWMLSAMALSKIGATIATLYATLGTDGIIHGINETEVTNIVTSQDQLPKLLKVLPKTSIIRRIIYFEGVNKNEIVFPSEVKLTTFTELEELGRLNSTTANFPKIRANDTAIIMYTSGSTGVPKGVMISHRNLLSSANAYNAIRYGLSDHIVYYAYLPLAHVLELASEFYFISFGNTIAYGSPFTMTDKSTGLKKGCPGDLTLCKATLINGVPLVLDRISKGIMEEIENKGDFAKQLFDFLINYKRNWVNQGYDTPIINKLLCNKIKQIMGGRVKWMAVGGAPLRSETHEFFQACLDVKVLQGYGLTEIGAAGTLMDFFEISTGRVGSPLLGTQIKLIDWVEGNYRVNDKPYPRGEIVIGGPMVTKGYFKNDRLTEEAYSEENGIRWFHTGDIGEIYPDGTIKIVDRRKDLIKLQFGEYISLGKIESELKSSKYVENICVIGDSSQDHLIALVVPNVKTIKTLAESLGKGYLTYQQLCSDAEITKVVTNDIIEFCRKHGLHKMETPAKIHLCSEEWLPDSGLVTSALKIRRKNIHDHYKGVIRNLYESNSRAK